MKLEKPKYNIGEILEDGSIYGGQLYSPEHGEYHLVIDAEDSGTGDYNKYPVIRLPTKHELNHMYLMRDKIPNLNQDAFYWSSTENYYNFAWSQRFSDGVQGSYNKSTGSLLIRCLKRFKVINNYEIQNKLEKMEFELAELKKQLSGGNI